MPVEKVLDNLLVSEQVYYNDLQGLIQNVAVPLQNAKILSQEVSDVLFGSLPDMLDSSQLFIKELTRIKDDLWGDSGIGYIVMGLTSCISKTYSEFIEKIPLRWQYCHILRQQSAMLEHIQHKEDADEGNNNDNWPDLLLESPVSRILDYLQLFKGFIQFANEQETHSEMITSAVGQLDQIIKRILEVQQQLKRWKDVVALANCIDISNFHVKVTDFVS
ncbi:Dbl homology domain-containing protein [Syncephalis plumigaleata]|nr:Dbl homology domain-containing protein [Syncephalis plumigaleata]